MERASLPSGVTARSVLRSDRAPCEKCNGADDLRKDSVAAYHQRDIIVFVCHEHLCGDNF